MKRAIKVTIWTVGVLLALLAAAAVLVMLLFDPNKYKPEITAAAHKFTKRDLVIQGDLKLSLFPWLGLETGAISLSNPPDFDKEPFAKIKGAAIKVKLLPLFKKEVEVDTVTLDGLYLHMIRKASGKTNLGRFAEGEEKKPQEKVPPTRTTPGAIRQVAAWAIGGVQVKDATVIWDDRQHKIRYELNKLSLHTGPIALNKPVAVEISGDVKSTAPALTAHLDASGMATYDLDAQRLGLKGVKLGIQAHPRDLPVDEVKLALSGDALLQLADKLYQANGLQLHVSLGGKDLPGEQLDATIDGNVKTDLKNETLRVDPLQLAAWNLKAGGVIRGDNLLKAASFSGDLIIPEFNARELLGHLSPGTLHTADAKALEKVGAKLQFNATGKDLEFPTLEVSLDQTHVTGKASLKDFAHPAYGFRLTVDDIDADRYLPPSAAANTEPVTPAAAGAAAVELPLETLRNLNVDGTLELGKIKIAKLTASKLKAGITAKGGLIRAAPLSADLYSGNYHGELQLDARDKAVHVSTNEKLNGIEIGPLVKDFMGKDLVAGTSNVQLALNGTGLDPESLKRTLNGKLGFSLQKGWVNGVNLIEMIQKDYLKYIQGMSVNAGKLNQTVFSKFAATATINNGLIDTRDMVLDSAQLDVKGRGTANLVDERLALHLDALPAGQLAKQLGKYGNTVIPIRVEGTFTAPKFATDLDEALREKAKARLEKEKQKAETRLQQRLDDKQKQLEKKTEEQLKNKLKGLFK